MKRANFLASSCRFCRFYNPEGRRGGFCQKLNVPVESNWEACTLSSLPFNTAWDNLEEIMYLEHSLALSCSIEKSTLDTQEVPVTLLPKQEQKLIRADISNYSQ